MSDRQDAQGSRPRFTLADIEDATPVEPEVPAAVQTRTRSESEPVLPGAVIKVVGVGGGGGNAINRMISSGVEGVEFIAVNTDHQALDRNAAATRIQIGERLTKGLGSGADPSIGREAALEDTERLLEVMDGADMIFVTTGLGGGTGTGASPVIASLAADIGALVVAVTTKPFRFEGSRRARLAEEGLALLRENVDTVITIPNEKLLHTVDRNTSMHQAFMMADDVLRQAVQGISDLILVPGEINLDFADVRAVMRGMGMALMGTGVAEGEHRAVEAAQQAISSPLLEDASIQGARGAILNITGGDDLTLAEVNDAASIIHDASAPDANIIFGCATDPDMAGRIKVTVIATGFDPSPAAKSRTQKSERILTHRNAPLQPSAPAAAAPTPTPAPAERAEPFEPPRAAAHPSRASVPAEEPPLQTTLEPFTDGQSQLMDVLDPQGLPESSQSDLDVPTFLRRLMD